MLIVKQEEEKQKKKIHVSQELGALFFQMQNDMVEKNSYSIRSLLRLYRELKGTDLIEENELYEGFKEECTKHGISDENQIREMFETAAV